MKEIFKKIKLYEKYQVSNFWNIMNQYWKILKQSIWSNWYLKLELSKNWKRKTFSIHRLVWQAFLWLEIKNIKMLVCHKDDNPFNNNKNNLFLWDYIDNMQDMKNKKRQWRLWKTWINSHLSKKVLQYTKDFIYIKEWDWIREIERVLKITNSSISKCCNWKLKTAWGFIWKFI